MDKLLLDIIEKGQICELRQEGAIITDDCEKLMYLALAEGQKQPTQIRFKNEEGAVRHTIFMPEALHQEELAKRDALIDRLGVFLGEVIGLPDEITEKFSYSTDDLYDFLVQMLELSGWGLSPKQEEMKFDRGDEIRKKDNIIHLTADLLQYNNLSGIQVLSDFYNYPDNVSADMLLDRLEFLIRESADDSVMIYVLDHPFTQEKNNSDLLPVFMEESGSLKIIAWISQEVIPHNLVPVFDIDQKLIGWLDQNYDAGKESAYL